VGRPVGHIVSNLVGYDSLLVDAQAVLDTLVSRERQVRDDVWLLVHDADSTLPNSGQRDRGCRHYVRRHHRIETRRRGARQRRTISFVMAVVVRDSSDAITVLDLDGRIIAWNPYGCSYVRLE
jgi:two-component system CheB/CheR fusion protein